MIKLYDSQVAQILPRYFAEKPEVQALSYALRNAVRKVLDYADSTLVYANMDEVSESILDMLAAELNTQYYDNSLSVDVKRSLVKSTLIWYQKVGTISALRELVEYVFGEAEIYAWYEYGDDAYYFKVSTSSSEDEDTLVDELEALLKNVKNARSHLRQVDFETTFEVELSLGAGYICAVTLDVGSASGDTIYIIIIDNEQIMSTAVWAEDADSDGLYDTLASYSAISGSYSDGNLVLEVPDDAAFCIY